MSGFSRRKFLEWLGLTGAGAALTLTGCAPATQEEASPTESASQPAATSEAQATVEPTAQQVETEPVEPEVTEVVEMQEEQAPQAGEPAYLAIMHGDDPATITRAAVDALGGMSRFVKPGNDVIVKPNICNNNNTYEYASTTNPTVVATLVTMAYEAGAKRVRVMDTPYSGDPGKAYRRCGIEEAVIEAGGEMEVMSSVKFADFNIPEGRDITSWSIYGDIVKADVLINVPIAKDHGSTRLTLGTKNLMGVIASPNRFHQNLHQRIADLHTLIRPALTVVDAVRILTAHGPGGGNLDDVSRMDTVIASHDTITADACATSLFDMTPDDIGYIRLGAEMGLGEKNWQDVAIDERTV